MILKILFYIDPGTGMIIIQVIISVFAAIALFFKKIMTRIKAILAYLKKRFKKA
tara:strand:- start:26225 stop:26386 length:162 start_codon:yes stop_codon:yes gene_type:complete